jgi:acetyl-CoA synthetase
LKPCRPGNQAIHFCLLPFAFPPKVGATIFSVHLLDSERFNLAEAICRRHADRVTRVALLDVKPLAENCYTFGGLDYLSDKFASTLKECGINEGDGVAVILDQSAALVIAELGALKLGAAVVPLSPEMELSDLESAITDSGASALVAPFEKRDDYAGILHRATSIHTRFVAGDAREAIHYEGAERSFWRDVFLASSDFTPAATEASAPAFIFYVKTAEGSLRRVVHSHAAMLEQLAAFETLSCRDIRDGDALWCGEDWAAADLRLGLIYPAWWHGGAVVTKPADGFTGESALQLFQRCDVTMAVLRNDLLNRLLRVDASIRAKFTLKLRTVITRSETLTTDHYQQTREALGATLCSVSGKPKTGWMDKAELSE